MARIQVRSWTDFQHYKHRSPPWIKLHKSLLDNYEFQRLQLASKALAPMFWLLASESEDGTFDADVDALVFRLRTDAETIVSALKELIEKDFLIDASGALATRKQDAMPEKSREEKSRETTLSEKSVRENKKNADVLEVLDFLNEKVGRRYRPVPANASLISARLREGATVAECRQVIARKAREWKGTDQDKYLRPATLFNATKFAQYVGELVPAPAPAGLL